MIDFLQGTIFHIYDDHISIDLNGLGYKVYTPAPASFTEGERIFLFIHDILREDAHNLYGFRSKEEREIFELMVSVSGVGPKSALHILSSGPPDKFISAICSEDAKQLTASPGIGKKIAMRLILELKDKVTTLAKVIPKISTSDTQKYDVLSALLGLGMNESEALRAIESALESFGGGQVTTAAWVKQALRYVKEGVGSGR